MKLPLKLPLILLIVLFSCTNQLDPPVYDNPYDPKNPDYIVPTAEVVQGISNNDIIDTTTVSILWQGQYNNSEFSYKLDGVDEVFTDWSSNKQVVYNYLDEGIYTFYVKERMNILEQETATAITFTIDAVTSPGLVLDKMYTTVNNSSDFYVDLNLEEVSNFKGLTTKLSFANSDIELTSISQITGDLYTGSEIFTASSTEEANSTGEIEINLVLLGMPSGFTGNAAVCRLNFNAIDYAQTGITFIQGKTTFRDIDNNDITVTVLRNAIIDIN